MSLVRNAKRTGLRRRRRLDDWKPSIGPNQASTTKIYTEGSQLD